MSTSRARLALTMTAVVVSAVASSTVMAAPAAAAVGVDPPGVEVALDAGDSVTVPVRVTTPEVAPRPDIVFLGDTTGGLDPVVATFRNNLATIMGRVRESQPDARFAVIGYKDEVDGPRVFTVYNYVTGDDDVVRDGARRMSGDVFGGGAPWTDFINAHYRIATDEMAFRPNGTRIIAWFGDAASRDPSLGHTLADTNAALRILGARVVAVPIVGTSGDGLDRLGQATSITNATRGRLMPDSGAEQVAQALIDGITSLDVTVAPRVTSCDAALTVGFAPAARTVRSGTDAAIDLTVSVAADAAAGTYRCSVDYLLNGLTQGLTQTVTVTVGPDTTPPDITASVDPATPDGANGWYVSAPTVSFDCADPSGVASCTPPTTLGSSAQPQTVTGTAVDTLGNSASTSVTGLRVDLVDPTLACGPTPTFAVGDQGQVTATVSDAHSGPATPSASAPADTTSAGSRTVRIAGTDVAGRAGSAECPYRVGRAPTTLVAHPARLSTRPLLQLTLTPRATLTRTDARAPLAGQPIRFAIGGRQVCTSVTNGAGEATCTGPVTLVEVLLGGGYTASFTGTPAVEPATARGRIG